MLEGFALIVLILGLVILRQTFKKYRKMQEINKNCSSTIGTVVSSKTIRNMMGGPEFGTAYHVLIQYQPPNAKEPHELYLFEHNLVMSSKFIQGETVEVVYNAEAPYRAYPKPEWEQALRDFKKVWVCFGISAVLLFLAMVVKNLT
jgi:hypothetical protein